MMFAASSKRREFSVTMRRWGLLFLSLLSRVLFWSFRMLAIIASYIFLLPMSHCGPRKRQKGRPRQKGTKGLWLTHAWSQGIIGKNLSIFFIFSFIFSPSKSFYLPCSFHTRCILSSQTFTQTSEMVNISSFLLRLSLCRSHQPLSLL